MTQEDKDLLLKDLSARLPYGVICEVKITAKYSDAHKPSVNTWKGNIWGITTNEPYTAWVYSFITIYPCGPKQNMCSIEECKPYLRPMSSMTEEEKKEYNSFIGGIKPFNSDFSAYPKEYKYVYEFDIKNYINWLNAHHFDYQGLIEKGLAIEVTEENNPYKRFKI